MFSVVESQHDLEPGEQRHLSDMLMNALPGMVLLLRACTRKIVAANRMAMSVGAIPGATCFGALMQRDDPCPWCLAEEVLSNGEPQRREVEAHGTVWDAHWLPVDGDSYLHVLFDTTERRQTELALRESIQEARQARAETESLLRGARSLLECSCFGDAARKIFAECKHLTGASAGYVALLSEDGTRNEVLFLEAGGSPCTVDPDQPMPIRGLRAEVYRTATATYHNDFVASEWSHLLPPGHVQLRNVLFAPLVLGGTVIGLMGLGNKPSDFTERDARIATAFAELAAIALSRQKTADALRSSEERLRQGEKMNAIGQLAGGIAHDFNNQLTGILGLADSLAANLQDDEQREDVMQIVRCAEHSAELITHLLAFARRNMSYQTPVDIHQTIENVVSLLRRSIDKSIEISCHLTAARPVVIGDPAQLENALLNLGLNARDAMPAGGSLRMDTERVLVSSSRSAGSSPVGVAPGAYVQVSVTDTGIGMDQETRRRCFEPFFTTKEQGQGTGMGLAAVYGTVKSHGGTIEVESAAGWGTTYRIFLPVTGESVAKADVLPEEAAPIRSASILVVDDEQPVRDMLVTVLQQLGYRVTSCSNGEEAVSWYRDAWKQTDLVILDLVMPVMGGHDTISALRRINTEARILVSSGYFMKPEERKQLEDETVGFLSKPYRLSTLRKTLQRIL